MLTAGKSVSCPYTRLSPPTLPHSTPPRLCESDKNNATNNPTEGDALNRSVFPVQEGHRQSDGQTELDLRPTHIKAAPFSSPPYPQSLPLLFFVFSCFDRKQETITRPHKQAQAASDLQLCSSSCAAVVFFRGPRGPTAKKKERKILSGWYKTLTPDANPLMDELKTKTPATSFCLVAAYAQVFITVAPQQRGGNKEALLNWPPKSRMWYWRLWDGLEMKARNAAGN